MKITFNQIAAFILALFFASFLVFCTISDATIKDALKTMIALCGFYLFGSTVGSQKKDEYIANSTPIVTPDNTPDNTITEKTV